MVLRYGKDIMEADIAKRSHLWLTHRLSVCTDQTGKTTGKRIGDKEIHVMP
jgi:hypothetical protein